MGALSIVFSLLISFFGHHSYEVMNTEPRSQYPYFHNYLPQEQFLRTIDSNTPKLDGSFFPPIENMQYNATQIKDDQYPWIARVVHSKTNDYPLVCTAASINERVFITAARCVATLKVAYTTVMYREAQLPVIAIVLPSRPTKQMFDDVGLLVTDRSYKNWAVISLFNLGERSDQNFQWFKDLNLRDGTAVGYAADTDYPPTKYYLYEIHVTIAKNLCNVMGLKNEGSDTYWVPCYDSCTEDQHKSNDAICTSYLAGEGHVVIEKTTHTVVGIGTWGAHTKSQRKLVMGMAVPNSENFVEDYKCALKIRDDVRETIHAGYYDSLCNE